MKNNDIQMIQLYCTVCDIYDSRLAHITQRLSNNFRPKFTDEECITIVIWGIMQQKFELKTVYNSIKADWSDWFPSLPSYQAFNKRFCSLADAFTECASACMDHLGLDPAVRSHLIDSMPIQVANGRRSSTARVAPDLCSKGFCGSKDSYYYGVKLHMLGQKRHRSIPLPALISISPAHVSDLSAAKDLLSSCSGLDIFADKAYIDSSWWQELRDQQDIHVFTPVKLRKGQQHLDAADHLFSSAVSGARQAIESFFSWLQSKTHIHAASKVRSSDGLRSFIFARLAAACLSLSLFAV